MFSNSSVEFSYILFITFSRYFLISIFFLLFIFYLLTLNALLPWWGSVALVVISMVLTLIAGIIPSRSATKKDLVVALRIE